jgi:hypothetical protein
LDALRILPNRFLFPSSVEDAPAGDSSVAFLPGDHIQATVLGQIDARHVLLEVQNRKILAESNLPLPRGETLTFIVAETEPNIILRPLLPENSDENAIALLMKKRLATYFSPGTAMGANPLLSRGAEGTTRLFLGPKLELLFEFLKETSLAPPFADIKEEIERVLDGSGLFFENKIGQLVRLGQEERFGQILTGDLKGLLLQAAAALGSGTAPSGKDLLKGVERSLQRIELFQMLNLRAEDPAQNLFLHLPVWFGEQLHFVEMNLSLPKKDPSGDKGEGYAVLFLLSLPALGSMKVEARQREKDLFCRIVVSREDVAEAVLEAVPFLSGRFAALGLRPLIRVTRESEEEINLSWLRDLQGTTDASFTVRV